LGGMEGLYFCVKLILMLVNELSKEYNINSVAMTLNNS